jgi:hypothetical protein
MIDRNARATSWRAGNDHETIARLHSFFAKHFSHLFSRGD